MPYEVSQDILIPLIPPLSLYQRPAVAPASALPALTERAAPPLSSPRLVRWIYRSAIESPPPMFPSHLDGRFHIVRQDDKLRRTAVVMGAKAYDVPLGHSGRNNQKSTQEQKGELSKKQMGVAKFLLTIHSR
jgi:hypothetical protein